MTKHSKNNTASSIFSYAEYKKLDYGTKRQRLGNESMRRFDSCALCLQKAREPVACEEGHLFCKECVYTDLLTQKKDIKRQKDKLDALKKAAAEEKERAKEAARQRVLEQFEKGQLSLGSATPVATPPKFPDNNSGEQRGIKRKFSFDATKAEALVQEAEEAALRQIEKEQAESLKAKLPDFWLPSLTPTYSSRGPPSSLDDVKLQTMCRAAKPAHPISLKKLIPVKFSFHINGQSSQTPAAESKDEPMCPSCKKTLSNNTIIFVMKPCAHVVCKTCTDTLVQPAKQCIVCDHKLGNKEIVELTREGTGFAGGGLAESSVVGIAFQG